MANIPNDLEPIASSNFLCSQNWYKFFSKYFNKPTSWTTANRPKAKKAGEFIGYNTDTLKFEGFDGTNWINLN